MKAIINITTKQKRQYLKFIKNVAELTLQKTGLDKNELQKLIESGNEFQEQIVKVVKKLSKSNRYADEETKSNLEYSSDYKPKSIADQVDTLRQLFLRIGFAKEKLANGQLPPNAEGWFAIPRWEKIAPTYDEAVQKVFNIIGQTRKTEFHEHCDERFGPQLLHQSPKTVEAFKKLGDQQNGYDILVVPAQFGLRHRDRSVRRAREYMNTKEFGLDTFSVGIMILTHPKRLMSLNTLCVDCAGDEYRPNTDHAFLWTIRFKILEDKPKNKIEIGICWIGNDSDDNGSASGFIFQ